MSEELKEWISKKINEGHSINEVKSYLLSLNYPEDVVDKAIDEFLKSGESVYKPNKPKLGLKVYIGILVAILVASSLLLLFLFKPDILNFAPSKIEEADMQIKSLTLLPGDKNASFLTLTGEGEANIIVKNLSEWVSVPDKVELSSSPKNVTVSIGIPSNASSGNYSGSIIITTKENTTEIPLTIIVESNICTNGQTNSCTESHGCTGTRTCSNGAWGSCVSSQNWCDQNCDGTPETCVSGTCKSCPCTNGQTGSCTDSYGCTGTRTCSNGAWGSCVSSCTCSNGATNSCTDSNGCTGTITCSNGAWGSCVSSCTCSNGNTTSCADAHGCSGTETCSGGTWGSCVSSQNWCDQNCDGTPETCVSGTCKSCPTGHIYYAYSTLCKGCTLLAYGIINNIIGNHNGVELKFWTDDSNSSIDSYREVTYPSPPSDKTANHWQEIKTDWTNRGVPSSDFPNPLPSWDGNSLNKDILDATSSYICICDKTYSCYCDELSGTTDITEPMVEDALTSLGI